MSVGILDRSKSAKMEPVNGLFMGEGTDPENMGLDPTMLEENTVPDMNEEELKLPPEKRLPDNWGLAVTAPR